MNESEARMSVHRRPAEQQPTKETADEINIAGLDKAEVLAALFNGARGLGRGLLNPKVSKRLTVEDARAEIAQREVEGVELYFDYFNGRVMKVDLGKDTLRTRLYDRDNGQGAAERVISELRATRLP